MTSVKTMRMGFLDTEDRVLLDFVYPDRTLSMLITRRIIRRAIQGIAQILAQSSPVIARVPATHKTEMLIWEHLSALQPEGTDSAAAGGTSAAHSPPPWPVLIKLDINTLPSSFTLRFEARGDSSVTMAMSRPELHRLLATLRQLARHAEWDIDAEIGWLVEADAPQMHPGSLAS
jgi:hypothetical protein